MQDVDYLIIGAGAVGLAVADVLVAETDASIAIVDRNEQPGGHWNFAYDFVRLHQPSEFYGVESRRLGAARRDASGWNAGYFEMASGQEVLDYFDHVMRDHLLASGQVRYFPGSDYHGEGRVTSRQTGAKTQLNIRRKTVDATYFGTTIPAHHTPAFGRDDGTHLITPNQISALWAEQPERFASVCIVGAGKTGMDVGVHLIENGLPGDQIAWVMPRDSWLMNRTTLQPGAEFFESTMRAQAVQMQALAEARSAEDLFDRLERAGVMLRLDPSVEPEMYHCAIISEGEIDLLRQIDRVIRRGHVQHISNSGLRMDDGLVEMPENTLYIDCSASAVTRHPQIPIFQDSTITPQIVRTCQPAFSAAMIGLIETLDLSDAEKNELCRPLPLPDTPHDFFSIALSNMMNQYVWSRTPTIKDWMMRSRLDGFSQRIAEVTDPDAPAYAILNTFRQNMPSAIANIQKLMRKQA
ncbi:MAG: NAD(P)/FAD-dependent oxidoreductase [Hyphomonadaceae bacterium]|nr:NAD(P)/FAD-dependent oxidoreductase [Hyphomonadaceae bacterium]